MADQKQMVAIGTTLAVLLDAADSTGSLLAMLSTIIDGVEQAIPVLNGGHEVDVMARLVEGRMAMQVDRLKMKQMMADAVRDAGQGEA